MNYSFFLLMLSRIDVIIKDLFLCKFKIKPKHLGCLFIGLFVATLLAPFHLIEYIYYKIRTRKVKVAHPVFIVGHWRSGTTLWQYLLAQDKRFAFIDPLSGYSVNSVLWRPYLRKVVPGIIGPGRQGFDNMQYRIDSPWEDSVCFIHYCAYSNWSTFLFPQDRERYMDYCFVDELPKRIQKRWFAAYDGMIRKFTVRIGNGKPFVLKSPDITARVKYMSEKYPDAVFINVYRNPYPVIRSLINMYHVSTQCFMLQEEPTPQAEEEFIIKEFGRMYHKYFSDVEKIDPARIIEFKFEEFEKDPMPMLEETYKKFGWDWESAKDSLQAYWDEQAGYKKNVFDYSPHLIQRINDELGFYFEHYGYEKMQVPEETIYM